MRCLRARGEEPDVAEIVEGFVAREVLPRGVAAAADQGVGGGVAACGGGTGSRDVVGRCPGGTRRAWLLLTAEGIGDDSRRVEVREHFWAEGIDDFGDFGGELGTFLAEFNKGVGRGGVEGEDEWAEGFQDIHACFTEAEGGESNGREEDEAGDDNEPEGDPAGHVALNAGPVGPVGEEAGVEDVEEGGETHGDEEFPGCDDVPAFKFNGGGSKSFA